jgi:hypothetical protein
MPTMLGVVEFCQGGEWYEVITLGGLLMSHSDLNGSLFGVDNYGGFRPLFPGRGLPSDCSMMLVQRLDGLDLSEAHASWVLWAELAEVDEAEVALERDIRITEYAVGADGVEQVVTKWLFTPGLEWVRERLSRDPSLEVRHGERIFRRAMLRRADALTGTEFPLVMNLMQCLAQRFGSDCVRLVVWFD